jgi:hypothetical protein
LSNYQPEVPGSDPANEDDRKIASAEPAAPPKGIGVYERPPQPFYTRPLFMALIVLAMILLSFFVYRWVF